MVFYGRNETVETFSHAENGYLAALEGRAVVARNRARLWQAPPFHPLCIVASRRDSSRRPASLTTGTHIGGARRHFARDCLRLSPSRDRQSPRSTGPGGEPGGHPPRWPSSPPPPSSGEPKFS